MGTEAAFVVKNFLIQKLRSEFDGETVSNLLRVLWPPNGGPKFKHRVVSIPRPHVFILSTKVPVYNFSQHFELFLFHCSICPSSVSNQLSDILESLREASSFMDALREKRPSSFEVVDIITRIQNCFEAYFRS